MLNIDKIFLDSKYNLTVKGKFKITITIRDKVTILTGESGTGKTQLVKLIDKVKSSRSLASLAESNFPLNSVKVIRNPDEFYRFGEESLSVKDCLIIIDRMDKCKVTPEWLDFINNSDNVFILITRFRNAKDLSSDILVRLNSVRCTERRYIAIKKEAGVEKKILSIEDAPAF